MINQRVFAYIGLKPLLARETLPGAAPSDIYQSFWAVRNAQQSKRAHQQSANNPSKTAGAQSALAPVNRQAALDQIKSQLVEESSSTSNVPSENQLAQKPANELSDLIQTDSVSADPNKDSAAQSNPKTDKSALPEDNKPIQFRLLAYYHPYRQTLMLVELNRHMNQQACLNLIAKIRQSFTRDTFDAWELHELTWPLPSAQRTATSAPWSEVSDLAHGFLMRISEQKNVEHVLLFPSQYLMRMLEGDEALEANASRFQSKYQHSMFAQSHNAIVPSVDAFIQHPEYKAKLWSYIKARILRSG